MSKFLNTIKYYFNCSDKYLWIISVIISTTSLLLLKSVTRAGEDFFTTQLIAIILGYIAAICISLIDYRLIASKWLYIGGFCILFIIYTLIFGITIKGSSGVNAKAWILLPGGLTFQPSELVKIGFIITFSKHLSILKEKNLIKSFFQVMGLACHALIPVILTHLQGDDGAAIIFFFMFVIMTFAAGVPWGYFAALFGIIILAIPFAWNYLLADYQKNRIVNQFNPEADPLVHGYQQIQGKISIGSGRLFGRGLFNGPRVAQGLVPVQESDFIFSVSGEELGFIGSLLILGLIIFFLVRTVYIAKESCDSLGQYMCFGFFAIIASQSIFNLGMCLGLLPVMGVTLPFFSAGGSSSACLYLGIGLLQSIYMNRVDTNKTSINL